MDDLCVERHREAVYGCFLFVERHREAVYGRSLWRDIGRQCIDDLC
jgi:hypothetical protein